MRRFISYQDYLARQRTKNGYRDASVDPSDGEPYESADESYYADASESEQPSEETSTVEISGATPRGKAKKVPREAACDCPPQRKTGWVSVVILLICFGLAVSCAFLMSGGLDLSHLFGGGKVSLSAHSAYCVQMAAPSTAEEAAQVAADVRKKGGGGYVYMTEGLYIVLASAYERETDCDSVIGKLSLTSQAPTKYKIDIPAVTLPKIKDKELRDATQKGYEAVWQAYQELYAATLQLDSGNITASSARLSAAKIKNRFIERIEALEEDASLPSVHIKTTLTAIGAQLEPLTQPGDSDDTLSVDLKYAYLKILHQYAALSKKLST